MKNLLLIRHAAKHTAPFYDVVMLIVFEKSLGIDANIDAGILRKTDPLDPLSTPLMNHKVIWGNNTCFHINTKSMVNLIVDLSVLG